MIKKELRLNPAQRVMHNVSYFVKLMVIIWGRGTGKSSYGIGIVIRNIVHFLPRSKWLIVAESYKAMLENTLPSTIRALEGLGYYRDVHYVIGLRPPKRWPTAYEPPTKGFSNVMTFWNGTMFQLVSQDSSATSARGLNTDGSIVDESLNLDKEHYDEEIFPTIRANQVEFNNVPFHLGQFFFSSMPYGTGAEWLTDIGKYYLSDGYDYQQLMNQLITAQLEFLNEQSMTRKELAWKECIRIRKSVRWYSKKVDRTETFYQESNTFDNIRVMGYDYISRLYRHTSELKFMTEIMNKRMNKIEGAFYAKFDRDKHTYKRHWSNLAAGVYDAEVIMDAIGDDFNLEQVNRLGSTADNDCLSFEPLYVGMDFGGNFNCMVTGQKLEALNRFNLIKDFFKKSPDTIDELTDDWCEYYRFHQNKLVYLYYDQFGNQTVGNSKETYAEQVASRMREKGWTVILMTTGSNPHHHLKFLFYGNIYSENPPVIVSMNYYNCSALMHSVEGVRVKESAGLIKKDKSGEGKHLETEERQPHLSDAKDYLLFGLYGNANSIGEEFHDIRTT